MRATWLFVALAIAATLGTTTVCAAQAEAAPDDSAELDRAARSLFEAGKIAFDLGRYEEALDHLTQAFNLSKRPLLLFNIASTLDRLRRDAEALDAFERYLREVPDAPNRPAVEGRVRLLREAVERAKAEEAARAAAAEQQRQEEETAQAQQSTTHEANPHIMMVSDASDGGGLSPVVFIVGASLTAVAGVVTVISGVSTLKERDNYESWAAMQEPGEDTYALAKKAYDEGVAKQTRTNIFLGITGVLAVGTVVLALLTDWDGADDERPQVGAAGYVSADGGGLVLNGNF